MPMGTFTKVNGEMIELTERDYLQILTEQGTQVTGTMISSTAKERSLGIMEKLGTAGSFTRGKRMEKVDSSGMMEAFMKEIS